VLVEIFKPFKRGTAHAPGVGLGLSIVQELVDRHGARISAHSEGEKAGPSLSQWNFR
jgi:signal transduction histidine kinase